MKTKTAFFLIILISIFTIADGYSQNRRGRGMQWGKMDQLERMKMLDALQLDETTSIKLMSRFKDFRIRQREFNFDMDSLAFELKQQLDGNREQNQIKRLSEEYVKTEIAFNKNRIDFIYSLSDILTPEQIGRLLVFERNFKKELQDLIIRRRNLIRDKQTDDN
ncbi:MAG: hypothetical protein HY965_05675 [Ignavibacteriales bacterium]|nr:hypothetical protein [Ignavibacteriales bacterium]